MNRRIFASVAFLGCTSIVCADDIWNAQDLINADPAGTHHLRADIDLAGASFSPIGPWHSPFTGVFNGHGHTIRNMSSNRGLFDFAEGALIMNVNLVNVSAGIGGMVAYATDTILYQCTVTGGTVSSGGVCGGLIGQADGSCTIALCEVTDLTVAGPYLSGGLAGWDQDGWYIANRTQSATVLGASGTGTLVGKAENTLMEYCSTADGLASSNSYCGGLVGLSFDSFVSHCTITGTAVTAGFFGNAFAGGMVAFLSGGGVGWSVGSDLVVTAEGAFAGGIAGNAFHTRIVRSGVDAVVSGEMYVGGLTGHLGGSQDAGGAPSTVVRDCYARGEVHSDNGSAGGLFGTLSGTGAVVRRSYATSAISSGTDAQVGGLIGWFGAEGMPIENPFVDCYWDVESTGRTNAHGSPWFTEPVDATGLDTVQMGQPSSYATWNFATIWVMGQTYPELR